MKFRITAKILSAILVHRFHSHGYRAYWQQCVVNIIPLDVACYYRNWEKQWR
jgi:hypothetical protein